MAKDYTINPVRVHDYSLILGFTSCSLEHFTQEGQYISDLLSKQQDYLINQKIRPILTDREKPKELEKLESDLKKIEETFYKGNYTYLCFGEFDFLTIALIEGYGIGSRVFNSMEYMVNKETNNKGENISPFHTQVSLGALTAINSEEVETPEKADIFLSECTNDYPYIVVVKIKLNDKVSFEYGNIFTNEIIFKLKETLSLLNKIKFFLLKSYSWNELTLVLFTKNFAKVDDEIINVMKGWTYLDGQSKSSPSIVKLSTTLGFNYKMFNENINKFNDSSDLLINVSTSWRVCPARIKEADKLLKQAWKKEQETLTCSYESITNPGVWGTRGKGDITTIFTGINITDFIFFYREIINRNQEHVFLQGYSNISISNDLNYDLNYNKDYWKDYLELERKKLLFPYERIKKIKQHLKNLLVPHDIKDSIVRMFTLYNNGIADDNLFSRFIELHPILNYLLLDLEYLNAFLELKIKLNTLNDDKEIKEEVFYLEELQRKLIPRMNSDELGIQGESVLLREYFNELNSIVTGFYHAFQNRWHPSYITRELYDSNLFFVGGVHEMISGLEELYESACRVIGNRNSFIYVEAGGNVILSKHTLRLNKSYLFMPELLASVYIGEVVNQARFKYSVKDAKIQNSKNQKNSLDIIPEYANEYLFIFSRHNYKCNHNIKAAFRSNTGINSKNTHRFIDNEIIDAEFLEHVFMDIVSYYLLYQEDFELYHYWYWMTHFSCPNHYSINDGDGITSIASYYILDAEYRRLLLRYLIFTKSCNPTEYDNIKKLEHTSRKRILTNEKLFFSKNIEKRLNECTDFIDDYMLCISKKNIFTKWITKVIFFVKKEIKDNNGESLYDIIKNNKCNSKIKQFENGEAIDITLKENLEFNTKHFVATRTVAFCLLKSIYDIMDKHKSIYNIEDYLLIRKINNETSGKNNFIDRHKYPPILADIEGGDFVIDPHVRRKIFKYRNLFYQYLLDLANKEKHYYIKNLEPAIKS